jgi:cell division protein FtsB
MTDCADLQMVLPSLAALLLVCVALLAWGLKQRSHAREQERHLTWITEGWKTRAREAEAQIEVLAQRVMQMEQSRGLP